MAMGRGIAPFIDKKADRGFFPLSVLSMEMQLQVLKFNIFLVFIWSLLSAEKH